MVVILTFIVLGGGAYAAIKLPKNSVGTKQLKKGAVTKAKIKKSTLKELRGAPGPTGPQGAAAAAASPGGTIPAGVTLRGTAATILVIGDVGNSGSGNGISFGGGQLAARPVAHIVPPGGPSTAPCPGPVAPRRPPAAISASTSARPSPTAKAA